MNYYKLYILGLVIFANLVACSDSTLDEINKDKDNPTDVPLNTLLPVVQTNTAYAVVGGDMSLYMAVHTQLVTGVHAQLHAFDRLQFDSQTFQNTWNSTYLTSLKNLQIIMSKARDVNSGAYLGIAQLLYAYNSSVLTDMWGKVPYTEAATGEFFKPAYDNQQQIYTGPNGLIAMCDSAIFNLNKASVIAPGSDDLFYGGDLDLWKKAAWGMKARFITRLSNTPAYDANKVIDAVGKSFANNSEALIFRAFTEGATTEHPWAQEESDREHFAVSESLFNRLDAKNDPRMEVFFDEYDLGPAPNGTAQLDQGGDFYDKMYSYVNSDSPLELLTYDQLKFYEAEAQLVAGNTAAANNAFEAGVIAALERYNINNGQINAYTSQTSVFPGEGNLTEQDIHEQLYISFYPFQSQEAYVEIRRNDYPDITNPNGSLLQRLPWPQGELDFNAENNPGTPTTNGVWWDDLSDD